MFCPNCRTEYVEGKKTCSDCGATLVPVLPEEPHDEIKFTQILATFNLVDIAMIKSLLDNADIEYTFFGENFNQAEQLVQPAKLLVRDDHVDLAKEILKDFEMHYTGLSFDSGEQEEERNTPDTTG